MKNKFIFGLFFLVLACFFNVAFAQEPQPDDSFENIAFFSSQITVNKDNSIDVGEIINYHTGPESRHGIYRDIPKISSTGQRMKIDNIKVYDQNYVPYQFIISDSLNNVDIKIGDPSQTWTGQKFYYISYHATNAIGQFKDFDEIYWNVTGNEWQIPIYQAIASVILPTGTKASQSSCYFGRQGSTSKCDLYDSKDQTGVYGFGSPFPLNPTEGMTVAVGFPKGIVPPYPAADNFIAFFNLYFNWILVGILPLITLILSLCYWYKNGRDPKGTGVIVPQYDVPDNLTPMEVAGVLNQKVVAGDISAEIIYLATKGYLKITQIEEKTLGIFKSTDYELTKLKDFSDLPNDFDKTLLTSLFRFEPQAVKLSELKNLFYKDISLIVLSVMDNLLNKTYYKNLGNSINKIFGLIFLSIWVVVIASHFFVDVLFLVLGIMLSAIIYSIVSHFFPAKTEKGIAAKEYILGLKDYLRIAEKDRLIFHNAPEKKPEVFEKLLPYAMVLGVANIWAKEFEGIYTTPPSWYSGSGTAGFSAIAFSHSVSGFSSYTSSSLSSSPGGSGGGGMSGGGGGGGGGGGW